MILKADSYDIIVDRNLSLLSEYLSTQKMSKLFICVDDNTVKHCLPILKPHLPTDLNLIIIPAGEAHKTINTAQFIWKQLVEKKADRKSLVLNLGGGVLGDMSGFCASTFMRGISFIQIPTTLLSQVDASVGGKLGIDFMQYKNMVGAFKDPQLVFINPDFIKTQDSRELTSGFAEVIKHALIKDKALWEHLKANTQDLSAADIDWVDLIAKAVKIKLDVVQDDPFEQGLRKILNYGHSVGHAIESESFLSTLPMTHGEAIAVGMICEAYISHQKEFLSKSELDEISNFILHHFPKEELSSKENIILRMLGDKKNVGGKKLIACPTEIGQCSFDIEASDQEISESLDYYLSL